jgi:hypothetical protein
VDFRGCSVSSRVARMRPAHTRPRPPSPLNSSKCPNHHAGL